MSLVRNFWCKQENGWKYINIGLISKLEIIKIDNLIDVHVKINDVWVHPSSATDTHFVFDFEVLRKSWFECLGNTSNECDLIALETACMEAQLKALNHYATTPTKELRKCLFTQDLTVYITPEWRPKTKDHADKLEVLETYYMSDVHKKTYGSETATL